ncbi:MAG: hypothetical protein ABSE39_13005 [Candidatus Bathyarchaeia archaeon]
MSESVLASLKSLYTLAEVDLDDLFGSVTGVAKLPDYRFHIFIERFGIRAYVDCYYDRMNQQLIGESVQRL